MKVIQFKKLFEILKHAHTEHFPTRRRRSSSKPSDEVISSSGSVITIESVISGVQECALLVYGCWVVKSEILYPPNTYSQYSAVPSDLICRGRDYIVSYY